MQDLKLHRESINEEVCDLYFAMYMEGEWGVQVGYVPTPSYIADTQKTLLDWQEQSDCCALAIQSQPNITLHTCCPPDSTAFDFTVRGNCCPPGYNFNSTDGLCYFPGQTVPLFTTPCSYCPSGYSYQLVGQVSSCIGPTGDFINPNSTSGVHCISDIDHSFNFGPPIQSCPDKVYPFTILQYASLPKTSNHCSPFQPLCSGGRYKPCTV